MEKSPEAFRTISEVAESMDLPQHVLRFWETRFPQIKPLKRAGGRRYYRPDDVERLRLIKRLLYDEGYTIKGVQKLFKEQGVRGALEPRFTFVAVEGEALQPPATPTVSPPPPRRPQAEPPAESDAGPSASADLAALRSALTDIAEGLRLLRQALAREP